MFFGLRLEDVKSVTGFALNQTMTWLLNSQNFKQIAVCKYLDKKSINLPLCSTGHVTTDNMLKDLDVALRASRNYIESAHDDKMRAKTGDGFNLERQVC